MCSFFLRSSVFHGRTLAARRLIRDITPLSTAYFADGPPAEFLVGTGLQRAANSIAIRIQIEKRCLEFYCLDGTKVVSSENKVFLTGDSVFLAAQTSKGHAYLDLKL